MVNLVKQISDSLASVSSKVLKEKICPHCGVSLSKIVKTGRFGCPKDYVVFKKEIEPILNRLHSTTKHVGKVPAAIVKKKIKSLERLINKAIENEKYEEAARYRDEIKRLQS
jgi:protein arginine kinase activator